jgi:hypothetical protein
MPNQNSGVDWNKKLKDAGIQLDSAFVLPQNLKYNTSITYLKVCGCYATQRLSVALEKKQCRSCGAAAPCINWIEKFQQTGRQSLLDPSYTFPASVTSKTKILLLKSCGHNQWVWITRASDPNRIPTPLCPSCSNRPRDWGKWLVENNIQLAPDCDIPKVMNYNTMITIVAECGHNVEVQLDTAMGRDPKKKCRRCTRSIRWIERAREAGVEIDYGVIASNKLRGETKVLARKICGHVVKVTLSTAIASVGSKCLDCRGNHTSKGEKEVRTEVARLTPSTQVCNSRPFGFELDLLLPDLKLAIEYNGEYWHSEANPDKFRGKTPLGYHKWKFDTCKRNGITLAFVWESDWQKRNYTVSNALRRFIESEGKDLDSILRRRESDQDVTVDYSTTDLFEVGLFATQ